MRARLPGHGRAMGSNALHSEELTLDGTAHGYPEINLLEGERCVLREERAMPTEACESDACTGRDFSIVLTPAPN